MALKFNKNGEHTGNIIYTILRNRKVEDVQLFLNPDNSSDTNPYDIVNMKKGVTMFGAHLALHDKIAIVVDADADGFMSASIIYQYIKALDQSHDIDFIMHKNKAHGLTDEVMNKLSEKEYGLIIVPDAGSNDVRQIELLHVMGADVLVLDHHIIEEEEGPSVGVIINNQLGDKANKNLVGAGVTFKFCQAVDQILNKNLSEKFKDLVAVAQIADGSDISENEVRNMVFEGIKNLSNKFIKEALLKKDLIQPVPKDLSFSVIPMINAVVRAGTLEEKELILRAINDIEPENFVVEKKKKNKETGKFDKIQVAMNLQQYAVDVAVKCKTRQDSAVKKAVARAEENVWNEGGVAIIVTDIDENEASLTGLIATKMVNKLQKPVLVLRENNELFSGSGRGYEPTMDSLKDWCNGTNVVEFAQGHDQAFGLGISKSNLDSLKQIALEIEAKDFSYNVDYVSYGDVDTAIIKEIEKHKYIFGGKVVDPLFAYVNVSVAKQDIKAKGTVLSFKKNGVEFIMYGTTPEFQEKFTAGFNQYHNLDFIGRPQIGGFGGQEIPQIVLDAVDFSDEIEVENEITEFNIIF